MQHQHFIALISAHCSTMTGARWRTLAPQTILRPHFFFAANDERLIKIDLTGHMILICTCHFRPKNWLEIYWTIWSIWNFHVKRKYEWEFSPQNEEEQGFLLNIIYLLMQTLIHVRRWCSDAFTNHQLIESNVCVCAINSSEFGAALQLLLMDCIRNFHSNQSNSPLENPSCLDRIAKKMKLNCPNRVKRAFRVY